jgi:hypothetical protein
MTPTHKTPKHATSRHKTPSPEQCEIVRWSASLGAISAEALAYRMDVSVASARSRLAAARRLGWLASSRPLSGRPVLYTATAAGLRACGERGLDPTRVSASGAAHLLACAEVAAMLERCYPDHRVLGERELRRAEREQGRPLASAELGAGPHGERLLHRCDLVLWPSSDADSLPVAVEVELTVKAPARLATICRAWARCRHVAGSLYIAPPDVASALERAVDRAHARERVVIVGFDALPGLSERSGGVSRGTAGRSDESSVPSGS